MARDFTFHHVALVAQAIASMLATAGRRTAPVVVGFDTRFLSDRFAIAIAEVLAGNGRRVRLARRPHPTPALCHEIRAKRLAGGVMVTASHNPYRYNGLKWKTAEGMAAPLEVTNVIEAKFGREPVRRLSYEEGLKQNLIQRVDLIPSYGRLLAKVVNLSRIRRSRLRLLIDNLYGVQDGLLADLLSSQHLEVTTIHHEQDPRFGGLTPEPIALNLREMAEAIRPCDLGLAIDGDADRVACMQSNGQLLSPGQLFVLILTHLVRSRRLRGAVVKTSSCSNLIESACRQLKLPCHETPVGFKHIAKWMHDPQVLMGGEESGGIAIRPFLPERDGILAGLLILESLASSGRSLKAQCQWIDRTFGSWSYERLDLACPWTLGRQIVERLCGKSRSHLYRQPIIQTQTLDGIKWIAKDRSWLMLRPSGNEAVLRIYAESPTPHLTRRLLDLGRALTREAGYKDDLARSHP